MPKQSIILTIFVFIAFLVGLDITFDLRAGMPFQHIVIEVLVFIAAATPCVLVLLGMVKGFQRSEGILKQSLENIAGEKEHWKSKAQGYLQALAEAIDDQFERWHFSAAEKEIGLLILKGLSHKEIANIRSTSEKTVRQQAGDIYRKAGLEGKAQLFAFFLEDLQIVKDKMEAC